MPIELSKLKDTSENSERTLLPVPKPHPDDTDYTGSKNLLDGRKDGEGVTPGIIYTLEDPDRQTSYRLNFSSKSFEMRGYSGCPEFKAGKDEGRSFTKFNFLV